MESKVVTKKERKRLGDMLVESGLVTDEQVSQALQMKEPGQKLGDYLVSNGYLTEQQLISVLEVQLGIEHVNLYEYEFDKNLFSLISKDFAKRNMVIPLRKVGTKLLVAMEDPMNYFAINDLRLTTGFAIEPVIATKDEIIRSISKYYDLDESFDEWFQEDKKDQGKQQDNQEKELEDNSPIVKLVNQLLVHAVHQGASDIHIDPQEKKIAVRYRVDGLLRTERSLPKHMQNSLTVRVKIMADLDITEQRIPQDGRIKFSSDGVRVDLRISTLPTVFGEKVVIRILSMGAGFSRLDQLGFNTWNTKRYMELIEKPHGILLITGPTGSGKSSTLYATLNHLNTEDVNIITVEDPVEYQLEGINQVQVNTSVGMTFAAGLRSILRQDPNIVMVGEIRDKETAEIAIRASLTGHLVLSTLHTNDSISTLNRLIDMGVEPFLVATSLNGVLSQRLVRRICRDCKREEPATKREKEIFAKRGIPIETVHRGAGCPTCQKTGYRGRVAVHELLTVTDEMRRMLMNGEHIDTFREEARKNKTIFLLEDGLLKVKAGVTTTEEVLKLAMEH